MTTYNYSFSPVNNAQKPETQPLYAFMDVNVIAGPQGTVVLQNKRTDQRMIVNVDVAQALARCKDFDSLENHAQTICQQIPALRGQELVVLQTLQQVVDKGLFKSAEQQLSELSSGTTITGAVALEVVVITCDRPDALERWLASFSASGTSNHVAKLWVIDDSRSEENQGLNRATCGAQQSQVSEIIRYFGATERSELLLSLTDSLPAARSSLEFLLDHKFWGTNPTHGVARNWAQLLTAGCRVIVFDDDTLCQAIAPPAAPRGLSFASPLDRDAMFYASTEVLRQHQLPLPDSPIDLMSGLIGTDMTGFLRNSTLNAASLKGMSSGDMASYTGTSCAKLVQTGFWGDPGTGASNWAFFLGEKGIKNLLSYADPASILGARASWTGFRGTTVTAYGSMSAMTGMDNTSLLPPYFPAARNEDMLFAIMLQRMYPDSFVINMPWSIPHLPVDNRQSRAALKPVEGKLNLGTLIDWLGREPDHQWGGSPERLLDDLAQQLNALCDMGETDLLTLCRREVLSKQATLLTRTVALQTNAKKYDELPGSESWREYLALNQETLSQAIQTSTTGTEDLNPGLTSLRQWGKSFSVGLRYWPDIRSQVQLLINNH